MVRILRIRSASRTRSGGAGSRVPSFPGGRLYQSTGKECGKYGGDFVEEADEGSDDSVDTESREEFEGMCCLLEDLILFGTILQRMDSK